VNRPYEPDIPEDIAEQDAKPNDSKTTIKTGPNNPVGVVWIGLDFEHYGLHGTPEPGHVGTTASHGCGRQHDLSIRSERPSLLLLRASDADGLHEGQAVSRGQVIGYVGTSGNTRPDTPHLHFAVNQLNADRHWWQGRALDPYEVFRH
jgi:hypothetical protein